MKIIDGVLYRVTFAETGMCKVIECSSEQEMVEYVAEMSKRWTISNVVRLEISSDAVRTPKVAVKSHPYYKQLMKNK